MPPWNYLKIDSPHPFAQIQINVWPNVSLNPTIKIPKDWLLNLVLLCWIMREIIQFLFEVYHIEFDFLCRDLKVADRCNFLLISNSRSIFFCGGWTNASEGNFILHWKRGNSCNIYFNFFCTCSLLILRGIKVYEMNKPKLVLIYV